MPSSLVPDDLLIITRRFELPPVGDVDFTLIPALKKEAQLRFSEIRPQTVGQAGRIPGITPADVAILSIWLEKRDRTGAETAT